MRLGGSSAFVYWKPLTDQSSTHGTVAWIQVERRSAVVPSWFSARGGTRRTAGARTTPRRRGVVRSLAASLTVGILLVALPQRPDAQTGGTPLRERIGPARPQVTAPSSTQQPQLRAQSELRVGRVAVLQNSHEAYQVSVGSWVGVACSYYVAPANVPFAQGLPDWQGAIQIGNRPAWLFPGARTEGTQVANAPLVLMDVPGQFDVTCSLDVGVRLSGAQGVRSAQARLVVVASELACPPAIDATVGATMPGAIGPASAQVKLRLAESKATGATITCAYESPTRDVQGMIFQLSCPGARAGTTPNTFQCGTPTVANP